ncbi:YopX family protein [Campylobacter sp. VBCF_06 NA8]|uniref:YopX family protein n=1 Tax=Campylobacter sp. VBCF_06 NA8 TaxID=2983822 RepID=UPI0022E9D873|nr:YopX family protein [Campylobacter sp. VBCF_06 NA8]MDA3046724.1 YopX family protein [Campylobacter sp. VBCF_06 NA8]
MREIKFRAWLPHLNEMREVASIDFTNDTLMTKGDTTLFNFNESFAESFDTAMLMQYTGLKDHSGCEIFEGDIIEFEGVLFFVSYSGNEARYKLRTIYRSELKNKGVLTGYIASVCKIIGNIHQNSELLK